MIPPFFMRELLRHSLKCYRNLKFMIKNPCGSMHTMIICRRNEEILKKCYNNQEMFVTKICE